MVAVVVIEFSVMRCQPLRRALALFQSSSWSPKSQAGFEIFLAIFQEIV